MSWLGHPAVDFRTPEGSVGGRPVDPMGISDRLPTGTRTVYDPPLWSRFATANDETP
jgi:hypothetical protein